jgi:gamma-glutamylcyclotransferase (GGCT)/AIG2-like uncharacterized protein YtfP
MLYFAYGSNMDPDQMRDRCPNAEVVGIGFVENYVLRFPRLSLKRDCGVSSIEPLAGHNTWGVVYRLAEDDISRLDASEGYRVGRPAGKNSYNRMTVLVRLDGASTEVQTYIAEPQKDAPPPNVAYLTHIRDGARRHGIPENYLNYLDRL